MEKNDEVMLLQKKARFFFDNNKAVHIRFKKNLIFNNGIILNINSADFFILKEFIEGEKPIFYLEINDISEYTTKDEQKRKENNGI